MGELKNEAFVTDRETVKRILSSLGLCARAGKLVFGVPMICETLRKGGKNMPVLVVEASDTSQATHKRIADKTAYYRVIKVRIDCDGAALALALGKTSSLAAVAITDREMSKIIEKYI